MMKTTYAVCSAIVAAILGMMVTTSASAWPPPPPPPPPPPSDGVEVTGSSYGDTCQVNLPFPDGSYERYTMRDIQFNAQRKQSGEAFFTRAWAAEPTDGGSDRPWVYVERDLDDPGAYKIFDAPGGYQVGDVYVDSPESDFHVDGSHRRLTANPGTPTAATTFALVPAINMGQEVISTYWHPLVSKILRVKEFTLEGATGVGAATGYLMQFWDADWGEWRVRAFTAQYYTQNGIQDWVDALKAQVVYSSTLAGTVVSGITGGAIFAASYDDLSRYGGVAGAAATFAVGSCRALRQYQSYLANWTKLRNLFDQSYHPAFNTAAAYVTFPAGGTTSAEYLDGYLQNQGFQSMGYVNVD